MADETNRHPMDKFIEMMMKFHPDGEVARLDRDGHVVERMSVQDFAKRVWTAQGATSGLNSMQDFEVTQEFETELTDEAMELIKGNKPEDEPEKSHEDSVREARLNSFLTIADDMAKVSARYWHDLKRFNIPFWARLCTLPAFIHGLVGGIMR